MARVIVTGGAGFLGSHLCDRLVRKHEVICVDDFSTGTRENIEHLMPHPRFTLRTRDVADLTYLEADRIYNLACPASPVHYQADPVRTMKTNVVGMMRVLAIARLCGARVLQASTSEVYGDPKEHPQQESYNGNVNPTGPRACYDEGKRAAETLCFDYQRKGVDVRVARIFNTYGPRMREDDGRVVSNFICQALAGLPLTVYGDGSQTRSFCYVDDLITGLVMLMESDATVPVNLGNPVEFTIMDLALKVKEMTGSNSEIVVKDLPVDDPTQRRPDISRARRIGWRPDVGLDEGLGKTVDWFIEHIDRRKIA